MLTADSPSGRHVPSKNGSANLTKFSLARGGRPWLNLQGISVSGPSAAGNEVVVRHAQMPEPRADLSEPRRPHFQTSPEPAEVASAVAGFGHG